MPKVTRRLSYVCSTALLLTACQGAPPPEGAMASLSPSPSAQTVVLMDPRADDAMIPAISQVLSDGQVIVYQLNDSAVSPSRLLAIPRADGSGASAPVVSSSGVVQLTPPAGVLGGKADPRVTVYPLNSAPVANIEKKALDLRPTLPPPVSAAAPMASPFASPDAPERAVVAEPLIPPPGEDSKPAAPTRPPRGMTY